MAESNRPLSTTSSSGAPALGRQATLGLPLGVCCFGLMAWVDPPTGLSLEAWRVAALAVLMAIWWVTEAIPISATALLPIVLLPLIGSASVSEVAGPYANPTVFLFLGGFMLAMGMQRWCLHRRIAMRIIRVVGAQPARLVGGFMLATAFLSMWVSNTATAVMMLPIGLSVVELLGDSRSEAVGEDLPVVLLLGIAFAASIGGLGTLIGTPPNALFAAFMAEHYGFDIGFGRWMLVGMPLVAIALPLTWLLLTRLLFRLPSAEVAGGRAAIEAELFKLGPMSRAELTVAAVFITADLLWVGRPWIERWMPGLSDAGIAVGMALLLFVLPAGDGEGNRILDWLTVKRLPWDVLILFGGGLALADALSRSGLAAWVGASLGGVGAWPPLAVIIGIAALLVVLSELASNTATAAAFLPVIAAMSMEIGMQPVVLVGLAAVAASGGFMLPVATPPNAIVFGSGRIGVSQMVRAGAMIDLIFVLLLPPAAFFLLRAVFLG